MCFRCYENDTAPSAEMMKLYSEIDASLPADATGADISDATFSLSFARRGDDYLGRSLIRTAKRSGVLLNSSKTPGAVARPVLRAAAAGRLSV